MRNYLIGIYLVFPGDFIHFPGNVKQHHAVNVKYLLRKQAVVDNSILHDTCGQILLIGYVFSLKAKTFRFIVYYYTLVQNIRVNLL